MTRLGALLLGWCWFSAGCDHAPRDAPAEASALAVAERFVDAFYAWDPAALASTMADTDDRQRALYYQKWAEAGNYRVKTRRACRYRPGEPRVECAITVTDDIGGALGYVATDTFVLTVEADRIVAADFESDDPPIFAEVFAWMGEQRPDVLAGPCKDLFDGGTTPAECVREVVRAARDYAASLPR